MYLAVSELTSEIEDCVRCLREVATGRGNVVVAQGKVSTLAMLSNYAPKSAETVRALALVAAFQSFELRRSTNPTLARHELELAVLRACE